LNGTNAFYLVQVKLDFKKLNSFHLYSNWD